MNPVRLCCNQRHAGPVCPDGKVMCCLCFNRFDPSDLSLLPDGRREDVCVACKASEDAELAKREVSSNGDTA